MSTIKIQNGSENWVPSLSISCEFPLGFIVKCQIRKTQLPGCWNGGFHHQMLLSFCPKRFHPIVPTPWLFMEDVSMGRIPPNLPRRKRPHHTLPAWYPIYHPSFSFPRKKFQQTPPAGPGALKKLGLLSSESSHNLELVGLSSWGGEWKKQMRT